MEKLLSLILPNAKALIALGAAWIVGNQSTAAEFLATQAQQLFGVVLPDPVVSAVVGLVVAAVVWIVPNSQVVSAKPYK